MIGSRHTTHGTEHRDVRRGGPQTGGTDGSRRGGGLRWPAGTVCGGCRDGGRSGEQVTCPLCSCVPIVTRLRRAAALPSAGAAPTGRSGDRRRWKADVGEPLAAAATAIATAATAAAAAAVAYRLAHLLRGTFHTLTEDAVPGDPRRRRQCCRRTPLRRSRPQTRPCRCGSWTDCHPTRPSRVRTQPTHFWRYDQPGEKARGTTV